MRAHPVVHLILVLAVLVSAFSSRSVNGIAHTPVSAQGDQDVIVALGDAGSVGEWEIVVTEVVSDATALLQATLPGLYTPPASGNTYTALRIMATNGNTTPRSLPFDLFFGVVGQSRLGYSSTFQNCPDAFETDGAFEEVTPGETREFTICWEVDEGDIGTLVMFVTLPEDLLAFYYFALNVSPILPFDDAIGTGMSATAVSAKPAESIRELDFKILGVDYDASDRIVGMVEWGTPPEPGFRYVLARISVSNGTSQVALPGALNYSLITADGLRVDPSTGYCGNIPDPPFEAPMVFTGGTAKFNLCWSIPDDSTDDLTLEVSFLNQEPLLIDLPTG